MDCNNELVCEGELVKKDVATTLFIQSCKEGLADKMPVRTLEKFYDEEKKEELENDDIPF